MNGGTYTTTVTLKSWEGYTLNVTAPAQADSTGAWKVWASWSDGGARARGYVTPATAASLTATYKEGLRARVNFQPAGAPVPTGYVADTGLVFGARGNGLRYGWNADNSTQTRDRNSTTSPDQRYDTLTHLQKRPRGPRQDHPMSHARHTGGAGRAARAQKPERCPRGSPVSPQRGPLRREPPTVSPQSWPLSREAARGGGPTTRSVAP